MENEKQKIMVVTPRHVGGKTSGKYVSVTGKTEVLIYAGDYLEPRSDGFPIDKLSAGYKLNTLVSKIKKEKPCLEGIDGLIVYMSAEAVIETLKFIKFAKNYDKPVELYSCRCGEESKRDLASLCDQYIQWCECKGTETLARRISDYLWEGK